MTRVKRGTTANKRRKNVLKLTKGFRWGRQSKFRLAKDALRHAQANSFRDRKKKKGVFRALWQTQINAACRQYGVTYSQFIYQLKNKGIDLDRKALSQLAKEYPDTFKALVVAVGSVEVEEEKLTEEKVS
jgi:large subunit ribosomal protein L20